MSFYGNLYFSVLYPFYESTLKRRKTFDYYHFLKKSQWYGREQLVEYQFGEIQKLLRHAYAQVPFYQKAFAELGATPDDIKTLEDFARLPIIDKDTIRANRRDMVARDHVSRTIAKTTGGSTGSPLEFEYTRMSYEWRVATRMRGYEWGGYREGEKAAFIWGSAIGEPSFAQRAKEWVHNSILQWKFFDSFRLDGDMVADVCRQLERFAPGVIVSYATPIYNFAMTVRERGIKPPRVNSIITAAEKVQDYQREVIEEVFGCRVFGTYGCREFMLIASECEEHKGMHVNVENICAEIVHDHAHLDPGGPGELVLTDLHNYGMPFIRYKLGDLGMPAKNDVCACGRGLPLIADVEGRLLDTILTPEGKMVPGEFFPHLAKEFREIKQFQVVQEELDHLIVKIVQLSEFTGDPLERFKSEIAGVVGPNVNIDVRFVEEIPLTATGKFRVTVSNVWKKQQS